MEVLQYPNYSQLWKSALKDPRIAGLSYGDTISHQELRELIGLPDPAYLDNFTDIQTAQLAYVYSMDHIKKALLEDECKDLQSTRGVGYTVVHPGEQTKLAVDECEDKLKKLLRKTVKRVSFVDHTQLTDEQRKENTDALARMSFFRTTIKPSFTIGE